MSTKDKNYGKIVGKGGLSCNCCRRGFSKSEAKKVINRYLRRATRQKLKEES